MKYRNLGKTGISVSEIGFGTWGIGGTSGGAVGYGPTDDAESLNALKKAFELGVNFYDTSDLYGFGHSEELIGECFGGIRKDIIISSKVGFLNFAGDQDFSVRHINNAIEGSMKRLKTDYIDLYQLHSPPIKLLRHEPDILDTFRKLKRDGKVKAIGISVISPEDGLTAVRDFAVDVIEVNLNLVDQRAVENGLLELCFQKNIGVIVRTPLSYGFLTGKYSADSIFANGDQRKKWSKAQIELWASAYNLFLSAIAAEDDSTAAQLALRYCLSCPGVSTTIPGMLTAAQVEENVLSGELPLFTHSTLAKIFEKYQNNTFFEKQK